MRTSKLAQWVKALDSKPEDQNLSPENLLKLSKVSPMCNLSAPVARWEAETKESLNTLMPAGLDTLVMRVCLKKGRR